MKTIASTSELLRDLLLITKDGDWGKDEPRDGFVPYRVIRGGDFSAARIGNLSSVPRCYLDAATVYRRTLQANDILIETAGGNRDRPTGRTFLITQRLLDSLDLPATCASFCRYMRVDPEKADPRYVFWYLQYLYSRGEMWEHQVQHTGVARFQYTRFAEGTQVPLPHRAVQSRIADILGSFDDKIQLNRRMNDTLEAMARALFKSWFVDFDPVHAKAAVRRQHPKWNNTQVSRAAMPNLDPAVAELFPDSLEDSATGPIPAGWWVDQIGDVVKVRGGGTPSTKSPEFWEAGTHSFCTPKDMSLLTSAALLDTGRAVTDAGLARISSGELPPGTVLLSSRAPIGYLAIAEIPVSVNQGIIAMVCDGPVTNHYVLQWAHANMDAIEANANGSTFMEISKRNFRPLPIVIPADSVLRAFQHRSHDLHRQLVLNLRESGELNRTRDSLLPRLLSGDLRLSDAKSIVTEVRS